MLERSMANVALSLFFCVLSTQACSADAVMEATGIARKQFAADLAPASINTKISIIKSLAVKSGPDAGAADLILRPSHCELAFENALGEIYACERRNGYMELSVLPYASAARFRTALWRSKSDQRLALLAFPDLQVKDDNAALLKAIQKKRFNAITLPETIWGQEVVTGTHDVSEADRQDSAALAAFTAGQAAGEFKLLHAISETPANQSVVWGDLRALGETLIRKLDGKTTWHVPLNGYAQAITTTPGNHQLELVFITSAVGPADYEQPIQANLIAGHTYIVSFGMDDRPIIEDLGLGVHCERRKQPSLPMASSRNSWLACMK